MAQLVGSPKDGDARLARRRSSFSCRRAHLRRARRDAARSGRATTSSCAKRTATFRRFCSAGHARAHRQRRSRRDRDRVRVIPRLVRSARCRVGHARFSHPRSGRALAVRHPAARRGGGDSALFGDQRPRRRGRSARPMGGDGRQARRESRSSCSARFCSRSTGSWQHLRSR